MGTKLDWVYQDRSGEYHAEYKGIVIRAIRDETPENPFGEKTGWDGHWPMLVLPTERHSKIVEYDRVPGLALGAVLGRFNDGLLVHDQKAIGAAVDVQDWYFESHLDNGQPPRKWYADASILRSAFEDALYDLEDSRRLNALETLYELLGIPCLHTTVHGYSQGDQTDLLIVATPEAQAALRSQPADMDDETWARTLADDMASQAKLYKAWAFGDVYGYQLAREDEDGELVDLDDPDSSCWGYYGSDFDWSGLEEAAIDAAEGFVEETVDG